MGRVMADCRSLAPAFKEAKPGRLAACHLY